MDRFDEIDEQRKRRRRGGFYLIGWLLLAGVIAMITLASVLPAVLGPKNDIR